MSGPYVYQPEAAYQPGPYATTAGSHSPYSPFIPDVSLYPPSPYSRPGSLHGSPNMGPTVLPPVGVPFPQGSPIAPAAPFPPVDPFRQRRPSWHGPPPMGLFPPNAGHVRSNSFGQANAPLPFFPPPAIAPTFNVNWNAGYAPWQDPTAAGHPDQYLHPWLNGEAPRKDLFFDLSNPTFAPLKVIGANGQTVILGTEELAQPATYPPLFEIKIVCDALPKWPIILQYRPDPYYGNLPHTPGLGTPPITVGDLFVQIHRELHTAVTYPEWNELSSKEEAHIAKTFEKRSRALGPAMHQQLRSQGVKRVDYLLDKHMFRGLIRTGPTLTELKLIVGKP